MSSWTATATSRSGVATPFHAYSPAETTGIIYFSTTIGTDALDITAKTHDVN